eukprot:362831-Chlamydomonas_euryale.AAC.4
MDSRFTPDPFTPGPFTPDPFTPGPFTPGPFTPGPCDQKPPTFTQTSHLGSSGHHTVVTTVAISAAS